MSVVRHLIEGGTHGVALEGFGGGADKTGAQNAAAFLEAWAQLTGVGGGRLFLPPGDVHWANFQIPAAPSQFKPITIVGNRWTRNRPADPTPGVFMWDFLDDDDDTAVCFENIWIDGQVDPSQGQSSPRYAFNGVRVGNTNMLRLDGMARFVDGCGWHVKRPHNSKIRMMTYRSGKADASEWAFWLSGNAVTNEIFNDVTLSDSCATEKDYHGWLLEGGTILRGTGLIKLHGAQVSENHSKRALQIHCVLDYDIGIEPSLGYSASGFVHISDGAGGDGIVPKADYPALQDNCRGTLRIHNHHNVKVVEPSGGTFDLVTVDLGLPNSLFVAEGDVKPQLTPEGTSDWRMIGLAAPGHNGARIDLSKLRYADEDTSKWIDDRRTASTRRNLPVAASAAVRIESRKVSTSSSIRTVGEMVALNAAATAHGPRLSLLGCAYSTNNDGVRFASPYEVLSATRYGSISVESRVLMSRIPITLTDASGVDLETHLRRVQITAGAGLPGTHDPANHWVLDIYSRSALNQTLILSRGTQTSAAGDGLPNTVNGNATNGYLMDYWGGLSVAGLHTDKDDYVSAILRPVGSPAAIEDCQVALFFEIGE